VRRTGGERSGSGTPVGVLDLEERTSEPNSLSRVERDYYVLRGWREIMRRYLGSRAQWLPSSVLPALTQPLVCLG
jgi:hypothetical protein